MLRGLAHLRASAALSLIVCVAAACGDDGGGGGHLGPRGYDAISYELRGSFDWQARRLHASEKLTLVLASGTRSVALDSTVSVTRIAAGGAELPHTQNGEVLAIDVSSLSGKVTLDLEYDAAATSGALIAVDAGRDGDPVTARMVYTDSEPDRGRAWLPGNHRPDDRALWSVELTVPAGEDVVANGARTRDEMTAAGRVVRYELADPVPTYIMAFAAGQLQHEDRSTGRVPLAVWHRRGLVIDDAAQLDAVAGAMASFEKLIGPYPWDSYAVVLVPLYGGGMENATISFNAEESAEGAISFNLNAHELAHQWFGDWVTIETFDDLWIKEGLATLLAAEAARARRDVESKGRLFGVDFRFDAVDLIVDRRLTGLARYTSGPYERAAWLLTQIRARLGEERFWAALRGVLAAHELGTVNSDELLAALSAADAEPALTAMAVPSLTIDVEGRKVSLALADPAHAMLVPIGVTTVGADGVATTSMLAAGGQRSVDVPPGGYVALDEADVHPLEAFDLRGDGALGALQLPDAPAALAAFASRSPSHEERAVNEAGLPPAIGGPAGFASFYQSLDSTASRRVAELYGCFALRAQGGTEWPAVLAPILRAPALPVLSTAYSACGTAFATSVFGVELATLAGDASAAAAVRLAHVMSFDYGAAATLDALSRVATQAPQLELRDLAIQRLSYQPTSGLGYGPVPPDQLPAWQAFFRARLPETTSAGRLLTLWRGVRGLADNGALAAVGMRMRQVPLSGGAQRQIICEAHAFATATAFAELGAALQPWADLPQPAQEALQNPSSCP